MDIDVRTLVGNFAQDPVAISALLRQEAEACPDRFLRQSLPLLRDFSDRAGLQFLLKLLAARNLIAAPLCDAKTFTTEQSITLANRLAQMDPSFRTKLARAVLDGFGEPGGAHIIPEASVLRFLEIVSDFPRGVQAAFVARLLEHRNPKVRSKVTLLMGKFNRNPVWTGSRLKDQDARVRANAVESLWGASDDAAREVFARALHEDDNRIAGNALLGLYRLGDPSSIAQLLTLFDHPQPRFRATAAWVAGETEDPRFLPLLAGLMKSGDAALRNRVWRAVGKIRKSRLRMTGSLALHAWPVELPGTERRGIALSVVTLAGTNVEGLKPTQFAMWDGGALASDYDVQPNPRGADLAVAFALPWIACPDDPFRRMYESSLRACLGRRAPQDRWLVFRYRPAGSDAEEVQDLSASFTSAHDSIAASICHGCTRASNTPALETALELILRASAKVKGSRHVVLLSPPDSEHLPTGALLAHAKAGGIAVHGIAFSGASPVRELSAATGGSFSVARDLDHCGRLLENLYGTLTYSYLMQYAPARTSREVKIEVYANGALGEASWLSDPADLCRKIV